MALFNFLCQGWWYLLFWLIVYRCSICGESFIKTPWRKAHTQEAPIGIDGPLLGCTTSSVVGVLVYSSNAQMCLHDSFSVWGKTWPHIPPLPPPNPSVLLDLTENGDIGGSPSFATCTFYHVVFHYSPMFFSPAPVAQSRSVSIVPNRKPTTTQKANFPFWRGHHYLQSILWTLSHLTLGRFPEGGEKEQLS